MRGLQQRVGGDIWLCGGGDLAGQLLAEVDEFIIKLNPVVIGSGISLARRDFDPLRPTLTDSRAFGSGVMLLRYRAATG